MQQKSNQKTLGSRRNLPINVGNAVQTIGILLGAGLMWSSAQPNLAGLRTAAMVAGYLLLYFNSHSLMHYCMGRLVGIDFKFYSIGGSSHADSYPEPMRTVFKNLPFFAAHTQPASMKAAHPRAKALMFGAGIAGTLLFCSAAALFAYRAGSPGGFTLFIFNAIWQISSLLAETRISGDLEKVYTYIRNQ